MQVYILSHRIQALYKNLSFFFTPIIYLKKGETISPAREENGCWYYMSSNGMDEYEYCINDPIIRVKTTYEIDLDDIKN